MSMRVSLRVSFWGVGIAREKMEGRERGGEGGERERERACRGFGKKEGLKESSIFFLRPLRRSQPRPRKKNKQTHFLCLPPSLLFITKKNSPLRPELRAKLRAVEGDVCRPDCGLSAADLDMVRTRARFVVHCAASISFFEHVHVLLEQNYVATRHAVDLAMRCTALAGYVHVSTAYVNSFLPRGEFLFS